MLNIIQFKYGQDGDFLDIFQARSIIKGPVLILTSSNIEISMIDNPVGFNELTATQYNYAIMSDHAITGPDRPWMISPTSGIPLVDTAVFLINNVDDAIELFACAKHCREHADYYNVLFNTTAIQKYDNHALSIANKIMRFESGFYDFPRYSISRVCRPVVDSVCFDEVRQAISTIKGMNCVYA